MTGVSLFPRLNREPGKEALRFGDLALTYGQLAKAACATAADLAQLRRVAVIADPTPETCVAAVAALGAGVALVPISPGLGARELAHVLEDSRPEALLVRPGAQVPPRAASLPVIAVRACESDECAALPDDAAPDDTAFILYTSGTTGLPKGVQIPRRAIASNLDAIATAWRWAEDDVLIHALPLFHVHGLINATVGSLRRGCRVEHLGRFAPAAVADGFDRGATMMFGVPTMYHRLAEAAKEDEHIRLALGRARLLVSGSAPLPASLHNRLTRLTGQRLVDRYGMTETLMNCAVRADGDRPPGYVGPPVDGVEVRLVDDDGQVLRVSDDETFGEIQVRGPNLFTGYLNRPDATDAAMDGGWFRTGDIATRREDGALRIIGRRSTDLIKSGGYRIGAGEIETVLLDHPAVREAAVAGVEDAELGQRIVAWVVPVRDAQPDPEALIQYVAGELSAHKRPREVRFVSELPRNAMGKVIKSRLISDQERVENVELA